MAKCKASLFCLVLLSAFLFLFPSQVPPVASAPIIPILTAIATTAAGLFNVQVDTLHIAKYMRASANCKKNRGAFVRDLLYTAFYRSGQTHNVIVFNLSEEHRQRLYGVLFYGSVAYTDGTRFGVWVFENGVFENKGARGWHNWGMIGTFKKNTGGDTIFFHRRHRPPTVMPVTLPSEPVNANITTMETSTITASTAPISMMSSTTVKVADILLGFDQPSTLLIESADITRNFLGDKEDKPEKDKGNKDEDDEEDGGGKDEQDSAKKVEVNVSVKPPSKDKSTNDDKATDKSAVSKRPKSANTLTKRPSGKKLS